MFPPVIPLYKVGCSRVTHPSAAGLTAVSKLTAANPARLACVRHAASVRPEPGSNSSLNYLIPAFCGYLHLLKLSGIFLTFSTVQFSRTIFPRRSSLKRQILIYQISLPLSIPFLNIVHKTLEKSNICDTTSEKFSLLREIMFCHLIWRLKTMYFSCYVIMSI